MNLQTFVLIYTTCLLSLGMSADAHAQRHRPESTVARTQSLHTESSTFIGLDAQWTRVAGCARDITAAASGVVYVTGCDIGSGGASGIYRWNGAGFSPHPAGGLASAITSDGGNSYAIGSDALLYSSASDGAWTRRGTPDGRPITDVGAGFAGVWVITSLPNGIGGNAIARATPCPPPADRLLPAQDFCGWEQVPGAAMRVSVGATAWVVTAHHELYAWSDNGAYWQRHSGCFTDVAANGAQVYAVSCAPGQGDGNQVLQRSRSGEWVATGGAGKRVAVDASGQVWVVTDSGEIWRR